jgi:hypothetical protein
MKFQLHRLQQDPSQYWNGRQALPDELTVQNPSLRMAEFQLLTLVCSLHGGMSPYDLLTGSEQDTEKDRDMIAILTALQWYVYPRMPLTAYSPSGRRLGPSGAGQVPSGMGQVPSGAGQVPSGKEKKLMISKP